MATLKDLQYRQAGTTKGAIKTIDGLLAKTSNPVEVAALSNARAALNAPQKTTPSGVTGNDQTAAILAAQEAYKAREQAAGRTPTQTGLAAVARDVAMYGQDLSIVPSAPYGIQPPAATVSQTPAAAPAAAAPAAQPNLTKPDPASGDFWKVTTGADGTTKTEFDGTKYQAAYDAWYAAMNAAGYPTANYNSSPAGTVGQIGAGRDANGQVYSAITGPDGSTQMLNAQQIQQSVRQDANPQTSRDRAAADSLVAIIKSWGLQDDVQVGEMGAITFPSPKALTAYTGIVSQRMLDVLRNGGTQVDALNAGGYQVVARESDAWKAYAAQQGGK